MSEADIQLVICEYLALKRYFFWRQNNTPVFDSNRGQYRRMPKYAMYGIPDIILIYQGNFIGLEVKGKRGQQSDNQKEFERRCKRVGGYYYVVRSLEDVKELGL